MAEKKEEKKVRLPEMDDLLPAPPPYPPLPRFIVERPKEAATVAETTNTTAGAVGTIVKSLQDVRKILMGE